MQARTIEPFPTLEKPGAVYWWRRVVETALAVGGPLAITGLISAYQLYPRIPNISIVYLILILLLASSFGRYSSVLASIVAFLSFDYFLVPPFYTFTMDRWEEWIALIMFLITALLTSQLTAIMRQRTEQAQMRERELRILYELMRLMNTRDQLDEQLDDIVLITLHVFSTWGVRACAILLPDTAAVLAQQAGASLNGEPLVLSPEEEALAIMAFRQKQMLERRTGPQPQEQDQQSKISFYQSMGPVELVRFVPLLVNEQVQGIFFFRIEHPAPWFATKARMDAEQERAQTRITFFWSFLDQVTSLLERSHLRSEIMHQQQS